MSQKNDEEVNSDEIQEVELNEDEEVGQVIQEEERDDEENYAIIPPNGGWGWVVVVCAFYCNVVVDGIQLTFGIFLKSISETFNAEYSTIALAGSLMFGVHLLMGPVCSGFSSVFGLRPVTITGSLICCFGVGISYFASNYWCLYLTYGIIGGVGLGLVYMNSLVITSVYFTSLMPIAIAIVVCGTGMGTMLFAILGSTLLKVMTWQNSFLILASLAGSVSLAAISFKPLKPIKVKLTPMGSEPPHSSFGKGAIFIKKDLATRGSISSIRTFHSVAWDGFLEQAVVTEFKRNRCCHCCRKMTKKSSDVLLLSELRDLPYTRKKSYVEKESSWSVAEDEKPSSYQTIFTKVEYESKPKNKFCEPIKRTIIAMLDCHLLTSYAFLLFTISGALQMASLLIVYIYEKDRCSDLGFTEEMSVYFVIALGGANMFWRLFLGAIAIIPKVNYHVLAVSGIVIGGIATICSGLNSSIYYQFGFCVFFGLGMASFAVFRLVLLVELVEAEFVGNATGINLLFMGVLCIISPPLFGWAMEKTRSYNVIFITTGFLLVASGLMLIGLHKLRKKELAQQNLNSYSHSEHNQQSFSE